MPGQTSKPIRSLGVLTGGGDVPGLNAAIKALVYRGQPMEVRITGLRAGWKGITCIDRSRSRDELIFRSDDPNAWEGHYLMPLNKLNTRTIDRQGGTILQSTRTNPANARVGDLPPHLKAYAANHEPDDRVDLTGEVLANLDFLELDGLVVIGGDDTLSYGATLAAKGVPVWGIPKTMDNDVHGTDYCIGFQTAISRAAEFINQLRSSAGSHERIAIIELFGRNCGETSLLASYLAGADRAIIPEVPFDPQRLAELLIGDKRANPSNYAIVTISEGAHMLGGTA